MLDHHQVSGSTGDYDAAFDSSRAYHDLVLAQPENIPRVTMKPSTGIPGCPIVKTIKRWEGRMKLKNRRYSDSKQGVTTRQRASPELSGDYGLSRRQGRTWQTMFFDRLKSRRTCLEPNKKEHPPPFKTGIRLGTRLHIPLGRPTKSGGPFPFLPSKRCRIVQIDRQTSIRRQLIKASSDN